MKTPTVASPQALRALIRKLKANVHPDAPRYARLRDALIATIDAGHWNAGDRLPTEIELCNAVPFSLGTVQRALRALVDEGVVNRVQGRGTFVATSHGKIDDVVHCRFLADDGKSYLPVFSQVLSRETAKGSGSWQRHFSGPGVKPVRLDRIFDVNGEFNAYSRFYFDGARFKALAACPLPDLAGANLKQLLRAEQHVPPLELEQSFLIARIPRGVNTLIGVARGATGGMLEVVGRARGNDVVYFQQMFFPPSPRRWVPHVALIALSSLPAQPSQAVRYARSRKE